MSAIPPPPPPPRRTTTMAFKQRLSDKKFVIGVLVLGFLGLLCCGGGFMALLGYMGTPTSPEGIAAVAPDAGAAREETAAVDRAVPPPADVPDPEDPGESDVGDEEAEAEPPTDEVAVAAADQQDAGANDAGVAVAAVEPAVPEGNFETADGAVAVAEGEGSAGDAAVAVAAIEPPPAEPPPALPPPPLPAGPVAEPVVVAAADTTSPCGRPDGLTDEGHLRCIDHVLELARALTPDWHPPASP